MGRTIRNPLDSVRASRLFDGLDARTVSSIVNQGVVCTYKAGEFVFRQGEPATHAVVIQKGLALLSDTNSEGEELLIGWLRPGDLYGPAPPLEDRLNYLLTVRAFSELTVRRWTSLEFLAMTKQYPLLVENILKYTCWWLEKVLGRLQLFSSENVERRLAILVCQTAEQVGRDLPQGIELSLSNEQLAQIAGTTLFSVSRLLRCWERSGLLDKGRGRILIHKGVGVRELIEAAEKPWLPANRVGPIRKTAT